MKNKRNYYRLLQVQPDAPGAIIRASYRTLMQKLNMHPDLGGDTDHAAMLNQAYQTLMDPARRERYDRQLGNSLHRLRQRPAKDTARHQQGSNRGSLFRCPFCLSVQPTFHKLSQHSVCKTCRSPLHRVEKTAISGPCKRRTCRAPQNSRVDYFTRWPQAHPSRGTITDLSLNGLRLRCTSALLPGRHIKLNNGNIQAIGKVIRCLPTHQPGQYVIGIEFLTLRIENTTGSFLSAKV